MVLEGFPARRGWSSLRTVIKEHIHVIEEEGEVVSTMLIIFYGFPILVPSCLPFSRRVSGTIPLVHRCPNIQYNHLHGQGVRWYILAAGNLPAGLWMIPRNNLQSP